MIGGIIKNNRDLRAVKPGESVSLEQLLPYAENSVFRLTRVAMLRALEIHLGSPPLVDHVSSEKETTIALREISQGKVISRKSVVRKRGGEEIKIAEVLNKNESGVSKDQNIIDEIKDSEKV